MSEKNSYNIKHQEIEKRYQVSQYNLSFSVESQVGATLLHSLLPAKTVSH